MTAHKKWCVGGESEGDTHRCDGAPATTEVLDGRMTLNLVGYDDDTQAYVRLHLLRSGFVHPDGTPFECDLFVSSDEIRQMAQQMVWFAGKADALAEHNHEVKGDVYFPDCRVCRRIAHFAAPVV